MEKSEKRKPSFSRLAHVGVVVRDMDKTVKRLESLGMGPFKPVVLPPVEEGLLYGKPFTPDVKALMGKAGNVEIELFEPGKADSPWKEFMDTKGEGIQHIAFITKDPFGEAAELTKKGATIVCSAKWKGGCALYLDMGTGDILIEVMT